MDDFKKLTVKHLRELAKKHLVPRHSKLTKNELIAALKKLVPGVLKAESQGAQKPSTEGEGTATGRRKQPARAAAGKKVRAAGEAPARAPARGKAKPARGKAALSEEPRGGAAPKEVELAPPVRATAAPEARVESRESAGEKEKIAQVEVPPARGGARPQPAPPFTEPLIEGFFVARVAGEGEAHRRHLTEESARQWRVEGAAQERSGGPEELPRAWDEDVAVLMARDPHTLFVFWNFRPETLSTAAAELESPRPVLRVYEGETLVREEPFALESRSFYVHGLPAGRTFRVEVHLLGRDGRSLRLGPSSNAVALPPHGPSEGGQIRFMRLPPGVPLPKVEQLVHQGLVPLRTAEGEIELLSWERVPLPGSPEKAIERLRVERLGRGEWPTSPSGRPDVEGLPSSWTGRPEQD